MRLIVAMLILPALLSLEGCSPQMEASRALFGREVTITNTDTHSLTITRIVANRSTDNGSCIERPNRTLAPGESYSTTFVVCGSVANISVETDYGTSFLQW
jgi:hypothetical protein